MAEAGREKAEDSAEKAETKEDVLKEIIEFAERLEVGTPEFQAFRDYTTDRYTVRERRTDCIRALVMRTRMKDMAQEQKRENRDMLDIESGLQEAQSDLRLVEDAVNRVSARIEERIGLDVPYTRTMARMRKYTARMDSVRSTVAGGVDLEKELKKLLEIKYESL